MASRRKCQLQQHLRAFTGQILQPRAQDRSNNILFQVVLHDDVVLQIYSSRNQNPGFGRSKNNRWIYRKGEEAGVRDY